VREREELDLLLPLEKEPLQPENGVKTALKCP